jgi:hypothetical protein
MSRHLPAVAKGNHKMSGSEQPVQIYIRTTQLPSRSIEHYRYDNAIVGSLQLRSQILMDG